MLSIFKCQKKYKETYGLCDLLRAPYNCQLKGARHSNSFESGMLRKQIHDEFLCVTFKSGWSRIH